MKKLIATTAILLIPLLVMSEKVADLTATDYVNDFAGILTADQKQELSNSLGQLEKNTKVQVAVAIVSKMEDEYGNSDYIEHYAVKLFEKWGIGKAGSDKDSDMGALFVVSIEDRQMRIEVGYGLEPVLTDSASKNILENYVKPEFKNGDYYLGIKKGVEMISTVVTDPNSSVAKEETKVNADWFGIAAFLFFLLINVIGWFFAIMARTKSWWLGGVVTFVIGFPILFFGFGLNLVGDLILFLLTLVGFLFDYLISKNYKYWQGQVMKGDSGAKPAWWAGGGWGPGSGGFSSRGGSGFGGFGGGSSGGGGSSSSW